MVTSSMKTAKKPGQKLHIFTPVFALFLLENHNILWSKSTFRRSNHISSSLLSPQRAPSTGTYPSATAPCESPFWALS